MNSFKRTTDFTSFFRFIKTVVGRVMRTVKAMMFTMSQRFSGTWCFSKYFRFTNPVAERIASGGSAWMAYHSWRVAARERGMMVARTQIAGRDTACLDRFGFGRKRASASRFRGATPTNVLKRNLGMESGGYPGVWEKTWLWRLNFR